MPKSKPKNKVIILGIDAMDAGITEKLMDQGRLPNFAALRDQGAYSRLATPMPTETVVSWASFATGLNPGGHGIFDFIMRNPTDYSLYLSLNEIYYLNGEVKIKLRRKGDAFWNILSKNKIPNCIYFCPNTFPPEKILGNMLSGMGVPDISGTMGKFAFYTTRDLSKEDRDSRGRVINIRAVKDEILTEIYGPKVISGKVAKESSVPLKIKLNPAKNGILLEFQGKRILLKPGKWSGWQGISFNIGVFKKAKGILRLYLKSISPEFELYVSPVNFDPRDPLFPISYPRDYSRKLAENIGLYYTQGMPYDTWALTEGRLDEGTFLELTDEIFMENERILKEALNKFNSGVLFYYFETVDIIQHMFWRYLDSRHPLYEDNPTYKDTVFKYYQKLDSILGEILKSVDNDTILIVLSDHGFGSFRRSVNLNQWLMENGYLKLKDNRKEGQEFFEGVDWPKTKAYALGFGGVYINRIGREGQGIVGIKETDDLKREIAAALNDLIDTRTNEKVINSVYFQEDIFKGPYLKESPDLFVGFKNGFRASWQTALGAVPGTLFEDNKRKWSGDHLIDAKLVPGVIFLNKKIELENPSIIDIAPTLLDLFDIAKPADMEGRSLFRRKTF
ncbi:MAG: alkaline phosphatase family protein [Candidatus Omnitrophota bacterium]|nr:alkaline phosphatase family protein [Candidatus Omnitrophota bacterium]MBU2258141.1 alkaline phosphatase family protein [Candidatus Omnitrophota bacterium]